MTPSCAMGSSNAKWPSCRSPSSPTCCCARCARRWTPAARPVTAGDDIDDTMPTMTRRDFLGCMESAAAAGALGLTGGLAAGAVPQTPGDRPVQAVDVVVLNPATRVPVSLIIDDSTCLVNLNRFAMPQFDEAFGGTSKV